MELFQPSGQSDGEGRVVDVGGHLHDLDVGAEPLPECVDEGSVGRRVVEGPTPDGQRREARPSG